MVSLSNILNDSPKTAEEGAAADRIQGWVDKYDTILSGLAGGVTNSTILMGGTIDSAVRDFYEKLDDVSGKDARFLDNVLDLNELLPALFGEIEGSVNDTSDYNEYLKAKQDELAEKQLMKVGVYEESWRIPIKERPKKQDELAIPALEVDAVKHEYNVTEFRAKASPQIKDKELTSNTIKEYTSKSNAFKRAQKRLDAMRDEGRLVTARKQREIIAEELGGVGEMDEIVSARAKATWGDYRR